MPHEDDWASTLDDEGKSPLSRAVSSGNQPLILMIMSMTSPGPHGESSDEPFHAAVRAQDVAAVKGHIDSGANPDALDDTGLAPLHWAAIGGSIDLAKLLLNRGAMPDIVSPLSPELTPLAIARLMRYQDMIRLLEQHTPY